MKDLARTSSDGDDGGLEAYRAAVASNPLAALPAGLRHPVWKLWASHQHLTGFATSLPIAGAVATWVKDFDLPEKEAEAILRRAMAPERMAEFKFASDLMAWLAGEAKAAIDRRRSLREMEDRRREREAADGAKASPEQVARLKQIFGSVDKS